MAAPQPQIIACGGGGFFRSPDNLRLERYLLKQTGKARPKALMLATASGDAALYLAEWHNAFGRLGAEHLHFSLFTPHTHDLEGLILAQDLIYVGGGNTRSMLALWREWGVDAILREAWQRGIVLCGSSAGSICWFEQGVTDSIHGSLNPLPCLGFLPGSNCPHYNSEPLRRPTYRRLVGGGTIPGGLAADDFVGLHYVGTDLHRIVSSSPTARAWRLERQGGDAVETELTPEQLEG